MNWKKMARKTLVAPGTDVDLHRDFDPGRKPSKMSKAQGKAWLEEGKLELFDLQDRFFAASNRSLLIVLQAIDAAGKDGTIKHVMSGMNPEGVDVHSFKAPSTLERSHDYLWRHQVVLPQLGRIAVFNRSHYENVTVTRVHPEMLWPKTAMLDEGRIWKRRYRDINNWERHLVDNGTVIVKLFLNVSREEQAKRFLSRIDDTSKNWKFSPADMAERGHWDDYQTAFGEMLSHTSTDYAPWHVIPADHKWFSRLSTFAVLLEAMRRLDPSYPTIDDDARADLAKAKTILEGQI
ncbi:MAG: polyphosphate kinase 2 family protein [Gordonia sp. (in: high G+C Gram-positive bacteria)]